MYLYTSSIVRRQINDDKSPQPTAVKQIPFNVKKSLLRKLFTDFFSNINQNSQIKRDEIFHRNFTQNKT